MFGILGTVIYGVFVTHEWSKAEHSEQQSRKWAKQYGNPTYRDKWGKERYTSTGKKKRLSDYQRDLHDDLEIIRINHQVEVLTKQKKQDNEIQKYKNKYINNIKLIRDKYNLSFDEYFYATHDIKLLYQYESFKKYIKVNDESLDRIIKFIRECNIRRVKYI